MDTSYKLVAIYHWSCIALPRQPLQSRCEMPAGVWSLRCPGFRDMWPRHSRVTRDSARHYTRPPSPHTLATRTVHHREDAFDITLCLRENAVMFGCFYQKIDLKSQFTPNTAAAPRTAHFSAPRRGACLPPRSRRGISCEY